MSHGYENTPPPTTLAQLEAMRARERSETAGYGVPIQQQQPVPNLMPDSFMGRWWRELVAICTGLAAIGGITWALGKQFFTTRDEWTLESAKTHDTLLDIKFQIEELRRSVKDQTSKTDTATGTLTEIQQKLSKLRLPR
jgi:hypothetical protein